MVKLILAALLPCLVASIRFHVNGNEKRCMKEEIHKDIVVTGEYEFSEAVGYSASVVVSDYKSKNLKIIFCIQLFNHFVQVTDTRGHTLYKRENFNDNRGKFAFTADEYDIFEICIHSHSPHGKLCQIERLYFIFLRRR